MKRPLPEIASNFDPLPMRASIYRAEMEDYADYLEQEIADLKRYNGQLTEIFYRKDQYLLKKKETT